MKFNFMAEKRVIITNDYYYFHQSTVCSDSDYSGLELHDSLQRETWFRTDFEVEIKKKKPLVHVNKIYER